MDDPVTEDTRPPMVGPTAIRPSTASTLSVRAHLSGRWTVVIIDGELDFQVLPLLVGLPGSETVHMVFDLHGVTFMDAGGLGALVGSHRKALHSGGCIRLATPSHPVRKILVLTGTDQVWPVFDSVRAAVSTAIDIRPVLAS
jgi:anti-anti-sigma factor